MKIVIKTNDAKALKNKILNDAKNGNLNTWEHRSNKEDQFITHSPDQWADKVILVFTPSYDNKELTVTPSYWKGKDVPTDDEKGTILGRFCERLWNQYKNDLSSFVSYV